MSARIRIHPATFRNRYLVAALQQATGRFIFLDCRTGRAYLGSPLALGR